MTRDFQIFGTACCIGIPLLAAWVKLWLWDRERDRGET